MFFDFQPEKSRSNLHTIPLERFLDLPAVSQSEVDHVFDRLRERFLDQLRYHRHLADSPEPIEGTGYGIASSNGFETSERCVIITNLENGDVVGGVSEMNFFILPEHRSKGLGAAALLRAFDDEIKDPEARGHRLSPAGRRTRICVHRMAVERAIEEGLTVPEEVLKDYPQFVGMQKPTDTGNSPEPDF